MSRLLAATVTLTVALGCTGGGSSDGADQFRNGLPSGNAVTMKVPGSSSSSQPLEGTATRRDGLEGETAMFYSLTRGVTVLVNTGVVASLTLIEKIVEYPPTSLTRDSAVWGPHTEALSPNTWRLTVKKTSPNQYTYALDGRAKTEPGSAFRTVMSGTHTSTGEHLGNGTFLIDWDKAQQLPEHDKNVGSADVTYSRLTASSQVKIGAVFKNTRDFETGGVVSATYAYEQSPGQGGALDFSLNKNLYGNAGSAVEVLTVRSRWQEAGSGRADVQAAGGDLPAPATVNECWDDAFKSRFFLTSYDTAANYGAQAACTFSQAEYVRK